MNLNELQIMVDRAVLSAERMHRDPEQVNVAIVSVKVGTVGHRPVTNVKSIGMGFDWEANSCIITPEKELREIELNEVDALHKKYGDLGRLLYEVKNLKQENRRLKDIIANADNE